LTVDYLLPPVVVGNHHGVDAAANHEVAFDVCSSRLGGGHEIVENLVCDGFVEGTLVAVRPQVELPRFEFHAKFIRNVFHADCREVRLSGFRAQAGKLGAFEADDVVPIGIGVGESFEALGWNRCHGASNYTS
jgi:hypothetical protein